MRAGTYNENENSVERISLLDVLNQPTTVSTQQTPAPEIEKPEPEEQTATFDQEAPKPAFEGLLNAESTANTIVSIIDTMRKVFYPRAYESIAFDSWELLELRAAQNAMRDAINSGNEFTPTPMQKILMERQKRLMECNAKIEFTPTERQNLIEQLKSQIQNVEWLKYLEKWGWIVILLLGEYGRFSEVSNLKDK